MRGRDEFNLQEAFELARQTIQALMLINGGAAAAVLAFFGNLLTAAHPPAINRSLIFGALIAFAAGLVLGTLASLWGYRVQLRWGAELPEHVTDETAWNRQTIQINNRAVAIGLASLGAFVIGVVSAGFALQGRPICFG